MPPRIVKAPCSSTGSSRVKPASTSRSASRCGSISVPGRISSDAASSRSGGLSLRKQRAGRRHDQTRRSGCGGVERAAAGRRDPEVRRHPAVRVDLQRRKRQHGPLDRRSGRTFDGAVEESRIRGHLFDVLVRRHDQQRDAAAGSTGTDGRKCLGGRRQPGGNRRELVQRYTGGGAAEQRAKRKGGGCGRHRTYRIVGMPHRPGPHGRS